MAEQYFYRVRVEYRIRGEVPMYLIIAENEEGAITKARELFAHDARHIQAHGKKVIGQLMEQASSANKFEVKSVYVEPVEARRMEKDGVPLVFKPDETGTQREAEREAKREACPHTVVTIYEEACIEVNRETGKRRLLNLERQQHRFATCVACHSGVPLAHVGL